MTSSGKVRDQSPAELDVSSVNRHVRYFTSYAAQILKNVQKRTKNVKKQKRDKNKKRL